MDLGPYVEEIHRQLEVAAEAGGDEAKALAERLVAPLDAAVRLALQDVLAAAAEEITVELAPGSVELRLRAREPEFVVTPPPVDPSADAPEEGTSQTLWPAAADAEEGSVSRINLRLPEHLKARIERAAANEGLSVNSWLVRAAATTLERSDDARRGERRTPHGAQRYTGWAR
ncbi:MAG TPA: toxin-antitoxin system HicB family antitoxin [Actinomycetota bacterium]|nr:toxin-antitoxin system HicB family antitoxin [Actinomycetota bacterium]